MSHGILTRKKIPKWAASMLYCIPGDFERNITLQYYAMTLVVDVSPILPLQKDRYRGGWKKKPFAKQTYCGPN